MAWTNLTNAALSTGKYLTQAIARALRDNVSAVANGDAGAPRIVAAGLDVRTKNINLLFSASQTQKTGEVFLPRGSLSLYAIPTATSFSGRDNAKITVRNLYYLGGDNSMAEASYTATLDSGSTHANFTAILYYLKATA